MRDPFERDKSIVELRALLASYEERLAKIASSPETHAARTHIPDPLLLINELTIDLRASALETYAALPAPDVIDCSKRDEPEPFSFVYKVSSGVYGVHPRRGLPTAAAIGSFRGQPPSGLVATAMTTNDASPTVRFHIGLWMGPIDRTAIAMKFDASGRKPAFLTVPPRHKGFLVSTDSLQSAGRTLAPEAEWSIVLATLADPPEEIDYAWAEFSNIVLIFDKESGVEFRVLA